MLTLRQAKINDLPTAVTIFKRAVEQMCCHGVLQWDEVYPCEATLKGDIDSSDMRLICGGDGGVVGAIVLNGHQDEAYAHGSWVYDEPAGVVHRLCIDPACQHKGYGYEAMRLGESVLKAMGFKSVRLDAFSQNPYALRLYESLGYRRAGETMFRKGLFCFYEKSLL